MTQEVDFADGYVSSETPNLIGLGNETYPIENNKNTPTDFVGLNFAGYTSAFGTVEVERYNNLTGISRQTLANFTLHRKADDSWSITLGGFDGSDLLMLDPLLVDTPEKIAIIMDGDQMKYVSGAMDDYLYEGEFKLNLNRIYT